MALIREAGTADLNKRKTPSELRREQLKRSSSSQDAGPSSQRPKTDPPKLSRVADSGGPNVCTVKKPKFRLSTISKDPQYGDVLNSSAKKPCPNEAAASTSKETSTDNVASKFKNVAELSCRIQPTHSTTTVDMAEAIKALGANKAPESFLSKLPCVVSRSTSAPPDFDSQKTRRFAGLPLDLSLKMTARFLSSTSFHWCHRYGVQNRFQGLKQFIEAGIGIESTVCQKGLEMEGRFWKGLHSWIYPQLSFPPAVLAALLSPAARAENEFMEQRKRDWEDSFHSLYYAFRNKLCNIFYFCAHQFVVVFLGGRSNELCAAYLSRSTRGLRTLLLKQGVSFTMPLCKLETSQARMEDVQDLSEFEKLNPGQTRLVDSMAAVDNDVQSLLAFNGSHNVHRLYDFLLNYRFFVGKMTTADLPVLYAPVPFHSASLKVPEVCSKQMQVVDGVGSSTKNSYSLEIKGAFLAPWVVSRLCGALRRLHRENFEVSFATEPTSEGLNVAQIQQEDACHELGFGLVSNFGTESGIKHLKCVDGSYEASL